MKTYKALKDVTKEEINNGQVKVETSFGTYQIDWVDSNWWIHCPKANGGFGQSFSSHPNQSMLIEEG